MENTYRISDVIDRRFLKLPLSLFGLSSLALFASTPLFFFPLSALLLHSTLPFCTERRDLRLQFDLDLLQLGSDLLASQRVVASPLVPHLHHFSHLPVQTVHILRQILRVPPLDLRPRLLDERLVLVQHLRPLVRRFVVRAIPLLRVLRLLDFLAFQLLCPSHTAQSPDPAACSCSATRSTDPRSSTRSAAACSSRRDSIRRTGSSARCSTPSRRSTARCRAPRTRSPAGPSPIAATCHAD